MAIAVGDYRISDNDLLTYPDISNFMIQFDNNALKKVVPPKVGDKRLFSVAKTSLEYQAEEEEKAASSASSKSSP